MKLADRVMSLSRVAAAAGVTRQSAHAWRTVGLGGVRLRHELVDGRILVRKADLLRFLRRVGREPVAAA
jgi:hypothetical protein